MRTPEPQIAASLMCADFSRLADQLAELRSAGVRRLHLDFADGVFVPNLILGTEVFPLLAGEHDFLRESHLMVQNPSRFIDLFAPNSDVVVVHAEAEEALVECIRHIRSRGSRPAVAINPGTPVEAIGPLLRSVDQVVVMTVHPGFAGGSFVPSQIDTVRRVRDLVTGLGLDIDIEVDGGINPGTIGPLARAGANVFVGGSTGLFVGPHLDESARRMRSAIVEACPT